MLSDKSSNHRRRRQQMPTTTVQNGKAAAFNLAHLTAKATEGRLLAEDLVEIGKRKAQRIVRKGYEANEDYLDESKRFINDKPGHVVGAPLAMRIRLGFLSGFLIRRT